MANKAQSDTLGTVSLLLTVLFVCFFVAAACTQGRDLNVIKTDNGRCFAIVVDQDPVSETTLGERVHLLYGAEVECPGQ